MNDEYAKTIVLGDGPLNASVAPNKATASEDRPSSNDGQASDRVAAPDYPAFEDTSWLT